MFPVIGWNLVVLGLAPVVGVVLLLGVVLVVVGTARA